MYEEMVKKKMRASYICHQEVNMNAHNWQPKPVKKHRTAGSMRPQRTDVPLFLKFMIGKNHEKGINRIGYTQEDILGFIDLGIDVWKSPPKLVQQAKDSL